MTNFRKTLLVLFLTFVCGVAFGQDYIVTKDGGEITAKVTEVNIHDIKYKMFNNPNGPVYTMLKSDIDYITYQNGLVERFDKSSESNSASSSNSGGSYNSGNSYNNNESYKYSARRSIPNYNENFLLMNDNEQENYLKINNPEFYDRFHKGQRLSGTGKGVLVSGCFFSVAGLFLTSGLATDDANMLGLGVIGCVFGQAMTISGIIAMAQGGTLKRSVQNEFGRRYLGTTKPKGEFQFRLSGNGIGLAYVF